MPVIESEKRSGGKTNPDGTYLQPPLKSSLDWSRLSLVRQPKLFECRPLVRIPAPEEHAARQPACLPGGRLPHRGRSFPVGRFKTTEAALSGPREGAFFMSEQLGRNKGGRNCRAVRPNECSVGTLGLVMNR